jgi:hypothetical protein
MLERYHRFDDVEAREDIRVSSHLDWAVVCVEAARGVIVLSVSPVLSSVVEVSGR